MLPASPHSTGPWPLRHYFQWLEDVFTRAEPRRHAYKYLCWLLSQPAPPGGEDGRNRLLTTARCLSREAAALAMIGRALDSGMPARWIVADAPSYGDGAEFREALERRRVPYVLASSADGPLVWQQTAPGGYVRWQLGRREGGSYLCYAPARTDLGELAAAASHGQAVRAHFASARGEAGLGRYSVRKWRAWYRHMTLAMFAHAVLRITDRRPKSCCRAEETPCTHDN